MELFSPDAIVSLQDKDVLIEIHDFIASNTSSILHERFARTHDIHRIPAMKDSQRPKLFPSILMMHLSEAKRISVVKAEGRPAPMEWFFMRSRTYLGHQNDPIVCDSPIFGIL